MAADGNVDRLASARQSRNSRVVEEQHSADPHLPEPETSTAPRGAVDASSPDLRGQATAASTSAMSAALINFSMSTRISIRSCFSSAPLLTLPMPMM